MYRSICIPVHPSAASKKAVALAEALAETFGARLTGLFAPGGGAAERKVSRLAATLPADLRPRVRPVADRSGTGGAPELPFPVKTLEGPALSALRKEVSEGGYDLLVAPARREDEPAAAGAAVGPLAQRLVRRAHVDTILVKEGAAEGEGEGRILVCIDGSQESYAGLKQALELARRFRKEVECVAVYDPYLHYTLFNGIVNVLTEEASRVFKFADQEKLHEEIIDTGLAKIYQAHLEVALQVAREEGMEVRITLLDGKAFQKILRHVHRSQPWLMVLGRVGVHSDASMDVGATSENLLAQVPCDVLVTSSRFLPSVDVQAEASIEWTDGARKKMEKVPSFVKGVATMAILRWAMERGHSIITPSLINQAMGDLLPPGAAQAMGYVAEEIAKDDLLEGKTFLCPECGHAARDFRPVACPVCRTEGRLFEQIDRKTIEALGELERGSLEEATFDGKSLAWTAGAKEVLRRVPSGYERRRAKARIEKTARVRGLDTITKAFAVDMAEQEMAENSYLSKKGEHVAIEVKEEEKPDDSTPKPREESPLPWTDAAWKRVGRVPLGFMRDMTREKVEEFARKKGLASVDLALCEEGIAEGRRMMAEMLGQYQAGGPAKDAVRSGTPEVHGGAAPPAPGLEAAPLWTAEAAEKKTEAVERVSEIGKFTPDRADQLARGVAETRARERRLDQIGSAFMERLGKQLGYGHPLSEKTAEHRFEWTPEAEARLAEVPEFCREMTRWRVEWTAVKKDLGRVITPEIMDVKYEMWGEVSGAILARGDQRLEWAPETMARLERIPDFVKGQVIQSVEGNARLWGVERVTHDVLDRVIDRWIETGDFHEGKYGYK